MCVFCLRCEEAVKCGVSDAIVVFCAVCAVSRLVPGGLLMRVFAASWWTM